MKQLLATTILFALSACGGGSTAPPSGVGQLCVTTGVPAFTMTSPAAGSTGVADSTSQLAFSGTLYSNTKYWTPSITVRTSAGWTYTTNVISENKPGSYSVNLPPLVAATTYGVQYTVATAPADQTCGLDIIYEGSFTTQ